MKTLKVVELECVNSEHNKFWRCSLLEDYSVFCEYGPIGAENPQNTVKDFDSEEDANAFIEKKMKEKLKKGYVVVND